MLVKLSESVYVDAFDVRTVLVPEGCDYIRITTGAGELFTVRADYRKSLYDTLDRLVKEVNTARASSCPTTIGA